MPENDACELWNLQASIDDQLDHCVEVRFWRWHVSRVNIISLEPSKEKFTRRYVIWVRTLHEHRYLQLSQHVQWLLTGMVCSSVKRPKRIWSPTRPLFVQFQTQGFPEKRHHTLVWVGLGQSDVHISKCIDSCEHAYPRCHLKSANRVFATLRLPFAPPPIWHAEPCFVQVEQHLLLWCLSQQFEGPFLS